MILGWSCIISLITFSSSFVLASEANDWSLILLDYCWFFNNIYILIVEGLNYNILRKNSLTFLIRTLSLWKKLLFFVKKGLTKFQNVLFETILFLMKVIKWNESFWMKVCVLLCIFTADGRIYSFVFGRNTRFTKRDFSK